MRKLVNLFILLVLVISLSGCATNRGYLDVQVPQNSIVNANGKQVFIRSITDNRQFQDRPKSADIPSIGHKRGQEIIPEIKCRAIARKRNGYGKAIGDILLVEGRSVQDVIYEATRNALYSLGYEVVRDAKDARPDAIIIDISIDKFWSWFMPGFWTLSLKSEITTTDTISVPKRDAPIIIQASSRNYCQVANTANWRKTINMVVKDFIDKAALELKSL